MVITAAIFLGVAVVALFSWDWRATIILAAIGLGALFVALRSE
jgi:hypothetical protein